MKVYTVTSTDRIDYDMSFEQRKLGCFLDKSKAHWYAKKAFEKAKEIYAEEIEKYSDEELYLDDEWDNGALWIEEDYEGGYYCISYGEDEDYESHQICVDEWEVEE